MQQGAFLMTMTPITLVHDMHMDCWVQCGCAHTDKHGYSLSPAAGIEYQEGKLYIMCRHCGRIRMWGSDK